MIVKVKVSVFIMLVSTMCFNSKAIPTNDTDYNYHIKAIELVYPIIQSPYYTTSPH